MNFRYDNRHEYDLKLACQRYDFLLPEYFMHVTNDELYEIWNGIGATGDWWNDYIPKTVYGVDVTLASLPHDISFFFEKTKREYHIANLHLLFNMNQIVRYQSNNEFMRTLRYLRTNKYYIGTETDDGWDSFVEGSEECARYKKCLPVA